MIGVGIVGCNYGSNVLLPAFRTDARCEVIALAGTNAERTAGLAQRLNVARGLGDWRTLVEDSAVAAVARPSSTSIFPSCRAGSARRPSLRTARWGVCATSSRPGTWRMR